jgi:GntR family transcriptional regulator of arabinose operon
MKSDAVNPRLPIPIPQQLKRILVEKVRRGDYIPGERIPAERTLSETYGISRISTREALTELIAEGYLYRIPGKGTFVERADQVARKLERGAFSVAFVIRKAWYAFAQAGYTRILEGVERALRGRNYRLVFLIEPEDQTPAPDPDRGREGGYDGLILVGPTHEAQVKALLAANVPFLLLDPPQAVAGVNCVSMDYYEGAQQAVRYLARLGHKEIGYLGTERSEKYRGHLEAHRVLGLAADPRFVEFIGVGGQGMPGYQHGREAMERMLARGARPTAMHITNDLVALGVLDVLRREGMRVPDDMSLVGYDDIDVHGQANPPLTTVCANLEEFGAVGVERLFTLMERPGERSQNISVRLDLVIRSSAGPCRQSQRAGGAPLRSSVP